MGKTEVVITQLTENGQDENSESKLCVSGNTVTHNTGSLVLGIRWKLMTDIGTVTIAC